MMKTKKRVHVKTTNPPLPPAAFDATPRLALVLTDETMYLTRFSERGEPLSSHPVSANDVAGAFNKFSASTGILPADVLFWQSRGGRDRLAIWLPPMVRALTFAQGRRDVTLRVPLPGFVLVGAGVKYFIFAATARPTKPTDQLYHAPLPNVHIPSGLICAGNVQFPKARAETLPQAATLFFESQFNSDLSSGKIKSQIGVDEEDEEEYDDEMPGRRFQDDDILNLVRERGGEPHEPISLFQFLLGLKGKREFPLGELVPALEMKQLLSGEKNEHS